VDKRAQEVRHRRRRIVRDEIIEAPAEAEVEINVQWAKEVCEDGVGGVGVLGIEIKKLGQQIVRECRPAALPPQKGSRPLLAIVEQDLQERPEEDMIDDQPKIGERFLPRSVGNDFETVLDVVRSQQLVPLGVTNVLEK
jgi:hypothetical protein